MRPAFRSSTEGLRSKTLPRALSFFWTRKARTPGTWQLAAMRTRTEKRGGSSGPGAGAEGGGGSGWGALPESVVLTTRVAAGAAPVRAMSRSLMRTMSEEALGAASPAPAQRTIACR